MTASLLPVSDGSQQRPGSMALTPLAAVSPASAVAVGSWVSGSGWPVPSEVSSGHARELTRRQAGEWRPWQADQRRQRGPPPPHLQATSHGPRRRGQYESPSRSASTAAPPVVWFPDLSDECETPTKSTGSSFNAFGFLAFVLSAVNLVSLLSSNVNNNINNNNNNNNNNDNNDINTNENNGNTNQNVLNQVMISPGRRRRASPGEGSGPRRGARTARAGTQHEERPEEARPLADPQQASLLILHAVLSAWSEATLSGDRCCALRAVCQAGAVGRELGPLGETLLDVFR